MNTMEVKNKFSVPIQKSKFKNFKKFYQTYEKDFLNSFSSKTIFPTHPLLGGDKNTHKSTHNSDAFTRLTKQTGLHIPLIKELTTHIHTYIKNTFPKSYHSSKFSCEIWMNSIKEGAFTLTHSHKTPNPEEKWISGALYLKNADKAPIVFVNPLKNLFGALKCPIIQKHEEYEIKVKDGDVIIFPQWLEHRTPPNYSNTERIVLTFNVLLGG